MEPITSVKQGAELLDRINPGWFLAINTEELDLGDCDKCVLGQLYGEYTDGKVALGFSRLYICSNWPFVSNYWLDGELKTTLPEWLDAIAERRERFLRADALRVKDEVLA